MCLPHAETEHCPCLTKNEDPLLTDLEILSEEPEVCHQAGNG